MAKKSKKKSTKKLTGADLSAKKTQASKDALKTNQLILDGTKYNRNISGASDRSATPSRTKEEMKNGNK